MSKLLALNGGLEKHHLQLDGSFNNDEAINLELVVSMSRFEKTVFKKDRSIHRGPNPGESVSGQVLIHGIHFTLIGNVHREWVFFAEHVGVRDSIYSSLLDNAYSPK